MAAVEMCSPINAGKDEQQICGGAMGEAAGVAVDVMNAPSTTAVVLASAGRLQFKFAVHKF